MFLLAVTAVVLVVRSAVRSSPSAPRETTPAVTTRASSTRARPKPPPAARRYYVIENGDTLEAIASRTGTSVATLLRLNPGIDPRTLRPGGQIRIR